jgi:protein-disulfide isomerase
MTHNPQWQARAAGTGSDAWKGVTFLLAGLLVASMAANAVVVWRFTAVNGNVAAAQPTQTAPGARQNGDAAAVVEISADDDPVLGDAHAPVQVIAFMDYECSFCARFYQSTFARLYQDYIAEGNVRFVTRDLPLGFHGRALPAALAASCVRLLSDETTFYQYQDRLMTVHDLSDAGLRREATTLGVAGKPFDECIADPDGTVAAEIAADVADAKAAGVDGTPTFFVNGRKIVGAQPYEVFAAAIDAELGH